MNLEGITDTKLIKLIYPTQNDLAENNARETPSLNYYVCIGKCQVFIRKTRGKYRIGCRGWRPKYKSDVSVTNTVGNYYEMLVTKDFGNAVKEFLSVANELTKGGYELWDALSQ